jgi:hypothetical protein
MSKKGELLEEGELVLENCNSMSTNYGSEKLEKAIKRIFC